MPLLTIQWLYSPAAGEKQPLRFAQAAIRPDERSRDAIFRRTNSM